MINPQDIYEDGIGFVKLVDRMGSDLTVVNAARVSYGKRKTRLDDQDRKLIRYLMKNRHTSPFEHCQLTFHFKVPLFVRSQHHRHRTWAYNEISRRYTSENLEFYFPNEWRAQDTKNKQGSETSEFWEPEGPTLVVQGLKENIRCAEALEHIECTARDIYESMIEEGVARELARMVLPQNLYTEYYGSVSLHNLLHFLKLRLDAHAQWEIRQAAQACLYLAELGYPETFAAWRELRAGAA